MNRIRRQDGIFQVLITPEIKIASDNPIMMGNWEDESLRNYYILQFETLQEAQCEALKYPDIDWLRISLNHVHIFQNLEQQLRTLIAEFGYNIDFRSKLMDGEMLKHVMFDRVMRGGERFNLSYGLNDIISFTIINPWSNNLHNLAHAIETHHSHLYRDDLRIRSKKIVDGKIICLYGYTELGTIYEIKLVPTLLNQWAEWYRKVGFRNEEAAEKLYIQVLEKQKNLDNGPIIR